MKVGKKLKSDIESLTSMKRVIQAYQEIAAMRMRRVKESVLQNRDFLNGLREIYGQVSTEYNSGRFITKKTDLKIARKTNGKTVSVLLSSNTGLYGDITRKTYDLFLKDAREGNSDIVIIGKYGKKFYENSEMKRNFTYFDFQDSGVDEQNTKEILQYVLRYTTIVVYHGLFQDILTQKPVKTLVTGKLSEEDMKKSENEPKNVRYIFEPSIEDILSFFESEILSVVFNQTVFESSLSKFASRMISLDQATVKVKNVLKEENFKLRKIGHREMNKDQITLLSGISLWNK